MRIINDCIKSGLMIELNGQCLDLVNVIERFSGFVDFINERYELIEKRLNSVEKCCISGTQKIKDLEVKVSDIEKKIIKCCKISGGIIVYPIGGDGTPVSGGGGRGSLVITGTGRSIPIPHNARTLYNRDTEYIDNNLVRYDTQMGKTDYHSKEVVNSLTNKMRGKSPHYGMIPVKSSNGKIMYYIDSNV